jgi:DNA-binding GntR family transcriptional regulator
MNTQPLTLNAARSKEISEDALGESLNASSLTDLAYKRIEAIILSGKLQGGERLNDSKLAKAFSISRGPVRSALARLADAGLVELIPYRGAFVRRIDLADVLEIYDVRAAVERAGVLAASRNMTPEILERLAGYAADMDASVGSGDREAYFETNLAFHQLLHQTSGNSRLLELYERYTREQTLFRHFSLVTAGIEESNQEHQRIVRALQAGDAQAAANEMEKHVLSAKNRLEQTVKKVRDEYN